MPAKLTSVALIIAMVFCMIPGLSLLSGPLTAYADEYELDGYVKASELTMGGDYTLAGDTTIDVDDSMIIGSVNIGDHTLQIAGDSESILSVWGSGITGYQGRLILSSGGILDLDCGASEGRYPAAISLPNGTVQFDGGNLFMNFSSTSNSADVSYGIDCANFIMNDGTATITSTAANSGDALGISCDNFEMFGGSMGVNGEAEASGEAGWGISNRGGGSNGNFYFGGGVLSAEGRSGGTESYGIDWAASSDSSVVIEKGTLEAKGQYAGLRSWCNVLFNAGAQATINAPGGYAIDMDGGSLTVQGVGTKLTATTGSGNAIVVYNNDINLLEGAAVLQPEGGEVKEMSTFMTIADTGGNAASNVVIEGLAIPTELALTYNTSKAFPTTRLTGREVSMLFLNNITSNPGYGHAADGWYVHGAVYPDTYSGTDKYTCLVKKVDGEYIKLYDSDDPLDPSEEYYFCFNIEDDGTRAFDTSKTYTATVNGAPADDVRQPGYTDDEIYVYKRVYLDESTDVIWSVYVTPRDSRVAKGGSRQFTAETVAATSDAVIWSISGNNSSGTYIDSNGVLHAASDETSTWIQVTATSAIDSTVSNYTDVQVVDYVPSIESVTVTADRDPVCRGTSVNIRAVVEGTDIHDLTWELIGSDGSSYFTPGGGNYRHLEVGAEETASQLTIRATSVADPTKYGEVTITIKDKEIIAGPINITYDASAVKLVDSKTGKQITEEFRNAISSPKGIDLDAEQAPGGWYVFYGSDSRWTSLVRSDGSGGFDRETLYKSDEVLSEDEDYYLWFNIEICTLTHEPDSSMDIEDLNITVNGKPVDGENIIAAWGGAVEVYVRINFYKGIDDVTLTVDNDKPYKGETVNLTATVEGEASHELNWEMSGNTGSSTVLTGTDNLIRSLTIGEDEGEGPITVKVTSKIDPTKTAEVKIYPQDKPDDPPATIDSVTLSVNKDKPYKGESVKLTATVTGTAPHDLTWAISGSTSSTTAWESTGALERDLKIGADETASAITVKVTSAVDPTKSAEVKIYPQDKPDDPPVDPDDPPVDPDDPPVDDDPLERIAGSNRYQTAFEAADRLKTEMRIDVFPNMVIASGLDFPDALAGAYLAVAKDAPVLLTNAGMAPAVAEYVKANMASGGTVYILGGEGAVPAAMETALTAQGITNVKRLAGSNRYMTNILILQEAGVDGQDILVCSGKGYADSLSASAVGKPILLVTDALLPAQKEYLESIKGSVSGSFYAIGGTGAVADKVFDEVKVYATGTTDRVAGPNRYETSVAIAQKFFPADIKSVVLAYAQNYPDGLAGGPVAYSTGSPLLLVTNSAYKWAQDYAKTTTATKVKVMGGAALISDETALSVIGK